MTILVDDAIWPFRGTLYCHMMSDMPGQAGLDELHAFAAGIGLKRAWFQNKVGHPHYDISRNKRETAIQRGAEAVTPFELIRRTKEGRSRERPLTKPKFRVGQFATVNRFIPPDLPSEAMVEIVALSRQRNGTIRYQCKEFFYGHKVAWVDEEDLD